MKLAFINSNNELELRWTWLPVFIGMNYPLMGELRNAWARQFPKGVETSQAVDEAHNFAVNWLAEKFKIRGLDKYLKALEMVEET